ncbi:MAG: ABC transporter substrate-binding protein [Desulfobacterales bacterium]|jgi:phospholipid transport system substrate-binding protein
MRRNGFCAAVFFCFLPLMVYLPGSAAAQPDKGPLEALKGPIEAVIDILRDPRYKDGANAVEQWKKLWAIAGDVFDFEAIARGTLKRYRWEQFTPAQQEAFTKAFTRFLGNSYFNQVRGKYQNEQVVFDDVSMKSESKALVKTRILREAVEIPVDYSMWTRQGRWRIYNVTIEGASLLGNYRNEFERVLQKDPPDHLISLLEKKADQLAPGKAAE